MKVILASLCLTLCLAFAAAAQPAGGGGDVNANVNDNANVQSAGGAGANVSNANAANANAANAGRDVKPGDTVHIEVSTKAEQTSGGGISQWLKDAFDIAAKLLTFVSVLVAVFVAREQFRKNRDEGEKNRLQRDDELKQREQELRWKKAELARELLRELFDDPYANDAMLMMDWNGRKFRVKANRGQPDGEMEVIRWEDMWAALRIVERNFNDKEKFVRDCFDAFFGHMQLIDHYISIELIELADVVYPFEYYLYALSRNPALDTFAETYHPRAAAFIKRLRDRLEEAENGTTPQPPTLGPAPPVPLPDKTPPPPGDPAPPAYFLFDCPPRTERFVLKLENPQRIDEARNILGDEAKKVVPGATELHLNGEINDVWVFYNDPWPFHVAPESVTFVLSAIGFAEGVNTRVEAYLKVEKKVFPPNDIWHTKGARLLAELPDDWFDEQRDMGEQEEKAHLRGEGRVGAVDATRTTDAKKLEEAASATRAKESADTSGANPGRE